jgi:hypothetical protein
LSIRAGGGSGFGNREPRKASMAGSDIDPVLTVPAEAWSPTVKTAVWLALRDCSHIEPAVIAAVRATIFTPLPCVLAGADAAHLAAWLEQAVQQSRKGWTALEVWCVSRALRLIPGPRDLADRDHIETRWIETEVLRRQVAGWFGEEIMLMPRRLRMSSLPDGFKSALSASLRGVIQPWTQDCIQQLHDLVFAVDAAMDRTERWAISHGLLLTSRDRDWLEAAKSHGAPLRVWLEKDVFARTGHEWSGSAKRLAYNWLCITKTNSFATWIATLIKGKNRHGTLDQLEPIAIVETAFRNLLTRDTASFDPTFTPGDQPATIPGEDGKSLGPVSSGPGAEDPPRPGDTPEDRFLRLVGGAVGYAFIDARRRCLGRGPLGKPPARRPIIVNDPAVLINIASHHPSDNPETRLRGSEAGEFLKKMAKVLTGQEYRALSLDLAGVPTRTIARRLSVTEDNVRTMLSRARRKLRPHFVAAGYDVRIRKPPPNRNTPALPDTPPERKIPRPRSIASRHPSAARGKRSPRREPPSKGTKR